MFIFRYFRSTPRASPIPEPTSSMSTSHSQRQTIALDTITRSKTIVQEHSSQGASLESSFLTADDLPALDPSLCPNFPPSAIEVVNADSFTAARDIIRECPTAHGKTAVLNLASDEIRAGGWEHSLSKTQVRSTHSPLSTESRNFGHRKRHFAIRQRSMPPSSPPTTHGQI